MSRSEKPPKHGDIVSVMYPTRVQRRRWCGYCTSWMWENGGVFRHGRERGKYCKIYIKRGGKLY